MVWHNCMPRTPQKARDRSYPSAWYGQWDNSCCCQGSHKCVRSITTEFAVYVNCTVVLSCVTYCPAAFVVIASAASGTVDVSTCLSCRQIETFQNSHLAWGRHVHPLVPHLCQLEAGFLPLILDVYNATCDTYSKVVNTVAPHLI